MSEPIDENVPNRQQLDPQTAERLGAPPREFSVPVQGRMLSILDQIRYLNDRIRMNTGSIAEALSGHNRDAQIARTVAGSGGRLPGPETTAGGRLLRPTDLPSPRLERDFDQRLTDLNNRFNQLQEESQRRQFLQEQTRARLRPDQPLNAPDVQELLADAAARQTLTNADPRHLSEAMAVRRLRNLNIGERLTGGGRGFLGMLGGVLGGGGLGGIAERLHAHHDDPLREEINRRREEEHREGISRRSNYGLGDRIGDALGTAAMRGGMGGAAMGGLLRFFASPMLGAALIAPEILRRLGINIPSVTQLPGEYRALTASGQLTGEGFRAGLGARYAAFRIGLNPFDTITSEIAQQIVESVRTAGFTGDRARELYGTVASVYRDLGLNIQTTTQIIADATRVGGESLRNISEELHGFDDAAHMLQMNINQYAESVMQVGNAFRAAGGGFGSTRAAQAFIAGAPRILREGSGLQQYQQAYQNAQPFLAAQLGVPIQYLGLRGNLPHTIDAFQGQMLQEIGRMPGDSLEEKAANASRFGIVFRGMDVPNIVQLIRQISRGRGPGAALRMENIRHLLNTGTEITAAAALHHGREWALAHGVSAEDFERAQLAQARNINPILRARYGPVNLHQMIIGQGNLRDTQRRAIDRLVQQRLITPEQQARLSHLVGDRRAFQAEIQHLEAQMTRGGGRSVNVNGVTISLSRGASKILRLDVNKEQVRQGTRPANRTYESESDRINLDNLTIP